MHVYAKKTAKNLYLGLANAYTHVIRIKYTKKQENVLSLAPFQMIMLYMQILWLRDIFKITPFTDSMEQDLYFSLNCQQLILLRQVCSLCILSVAHTGTHIQRRGVH